MLRYLMPPCVLVALLLVAGWLAWPRSSLVGSSTMEHSPARDAPRTDLQWMGVASCAAMACHHANGPRGTKGSEYTTWAGQDRHAQAYRALYSEPSQLMVRNLFGAKARHATETTLCLQCHAMRGDTRNVGPRFTLVDGVGCESCHGPAEKYLARHYQGDIQGLDPAGKAAALRALGMAPTKDLTYRIRMCSRCHVGEPGREVNHDLIAAGHPRLSFEFASYQALYPRHWKRSQDLARYPDLEVRSWILGQLITAQASLELLEARARSAIRGGEEASPWPEFAEYACYACHKDLQVNSPRQRAGFGDLKPGAFPWGTWYITMAQEFPKERGKRDSFNTQLDRLRRLMQQPAPDAKQVASQARNTLEVLRGWIQKEKGKTMKAEDAQRWMHDLAGQAARRADTQTWDETAQFYLALAAFHQGLGDLGAPPPPAVKANLLTIKRRLKGAFPPGYSSPRRFDPLALPKLSTLFTRAQKQLVP